MESSEDESKTAGATDASALADTPTADAEASAEMASPEDAPSKRPPDIVCQLWFDQFQHMSTLATAATAGGLILVQTPYLEATLRAGIGVAIFALAAAVALLGQTKLIDRIERHRDVGTIVRVYRIVTVALMGAGAGLFLTLMTG